MEIGIKEKVHQLIIQNLIPKNNPWNLHTPIEATEFLESNR